MNVAIALARSFAVALAAPIGRDVLGDAFVTRLERAGVDTSLVTRTDARMGLLFAQDEPRRFVSYRASEDAPSDLLGASDARMLVLSGLTPELVEPFTRAAIEARSRGARVILDVNARPRVWRGRAPANGVSALAGHVDVWKASEDDLATLKLAEPPLSALPPAVRILTRGGGIASAEGAFGRVDVAPAPLAAEASARSPMGAGDAFTAGLVASLLTTPDAGWHERLADAHASARRWLSRSP